MKRKWTCTYMTLVVVAAVAACDRHDQAGGGATPQPTVTTPTVPAAMATVAPTLRTEWSAAAIKTAEELVAKVRAAGIACDDYQPAAAADFGADYQRKLPLPGVSASCTTDGDEDLTFEVFESPEQAQTFVTRKQRLLCEQAVKAGAPDYPGFPYVSAAAWIVEPDEKETADRLAPILGGESHVARCSGGLPAPLPEVPQS